MADETVDSAVTPMVVEQMDEMPGGVAPQRVALFDSEGKPVEPGGGGASIDSVEVTTLAAGSSATASIEGTTLKLGIPRGADGAPGAAGSDGAPGAAGKDGAQGPQGVGVSAIALTTDETGKVTGGTWTDTESGSHTITVTTSGA